MNPHNGCCLFRCSGKSRASSCWPSSSVLLFWDWLSVSYFYQVHFSFTTHLKQHVGLDTVHCCKGFVVHLIVCVTENLCCFYICSVYIFVLPSCLRSPGEQVQYKACTGDHSRAVSGLLHHTGNDPEVMSNSRGDSAVPLWKTGLLQAMTLTLYSRERLRSCTQTVTCPLKTSTFTVMEDDTFGWPAPASSSWSVGCDLVC